MQSNKNSLLRCTLLQAVNMSLWTELTFQSAHTVQPTYVAPNPMPVSRHLVPWDWYFYMDPGTVSTVTTGYTYIFYIHGSVHRDYILIRSNEIQQYAGVYLLQNYSTGFGCLSNPSSGVQQTVTAASGSGHSIRATTVRQRGLISPRWQLHLVGSY